MRAAIAILVLTAASSPAAQPVPIYVYAAPALGGFVDEASKERDEAVRDLREGLAKRRNEVVIVNSPDAAAITVEVVDGRHSQWSGRTIRAVLHCGAYAVELKATDSMTHGARKLIVNKVTDWVKDNRDRLSPAGAPNAPTKP